MLFSTGPQGTRENYCNLHNTVCILHSSHTDVEVGFVEPSYTVNESSGSVSVCIDISGAVLERNVTVLLSTMDDEATRESPNAEIDNDVLHGQV